MSGNFYAFAFVGLAIVLGVLFFAFTRMKND